MSLHAFKQSTKTIQDQNFNQSIHMVYYREWSMEQEENKHKINSTGKLKDGEEKNTTITWKLWHIMLMFQEASPCLWINPGKPMTIITFLVIIRACGAIEPCLFVAYFLSYFLKQYHIFNLPSKDTYFFITWRVLWSSEGSRSGKSEGVVKVLTELSEAT